MYCTTTTIAQIPRVALSPKELAKMTAKGWSASYRPSRSVPMQNAIAMLMAVPRTPAIPMAVTIPHGTATCALDASSEMWTLESKEQMVQRGARKL